MNPIEQLKEMHIAELQAVDRVLLDSLKNSLQIIEILGEHIFNAGGKRIRPLLVLVCSKLFKDDISQGAISLSAAVECIHTATLVHDDVLDDADVRRGIPTAKSLWGNTCSILVGDFLFAKAFEFMVASKNIDILSMLSKSSTKICQGEVKQLFITNNAITDKKEYLDVIDLKTGTLFESACRAGAMISDADSIFVDALGDFGLNLGRSFQIIDDILDYVGCEDSSGKSIGNDYEERKMTLPIIELIDLMPHLKDVFLDGKKNHFDFIKQEMIKNNIIDKCYQQADYFAQCALNALSVLPDHPISSLLKELPNCLQRRFT
jgi:octaprenyl-diphosphate synthase